MNGIKAFNRFTIKSGDRVVSVHNETYDVTAAFTAGLPFGAYIAAGTDGAFVTDKANPAMSEIACVKATELAEYNTDPESGETFAVFTARLTDDDLDEGQTVGAVGLSHSVTGAPLADFAAFTAVTKTHGEDIVIKAEIRLTVDGDSVKLTGGDNALVRALLGIDGLGEATFELAHGANYHKTAVMPRSSGGITERTAASVTIGSDGLTFSGAFTSSPYEILLLMNGKVVLRGFVKTGAHVEKYTATLRENFSAEVANKHVTSVLNVMSSGEPVGNEYDFPRAGSLTSDCPQIIKGRLGKNARFLSESTGRYFAVRTDKEVAVYGADGGTFELLYKLAITDGAVVLTSDGGLMVACGCLCRYKFGSDGKVTRVDYDGVTDARDVAAVIEADGKADFMLVDGGSVTYRRETADGVTENVAVAEAADDYILGRSGKNTVYYASKTQKKYVAYCYGGKNTAVESRLRSSISGSIYNLLDRGDQWVRVQSVSMDVQYVMPISRNAIYAISKDERTIFCGNYCMSFKDGKLYRCMHFTTGDKLRIVALTVTADADEPSDAIVAGDYILALYEDGSVKTLYPVPYGRVIYCPDLASGTAITFDAVVLDDPLGTGGSARVTLRLTR